MITFYSMPAGTDSRLFYVRMPMERVFDPDDRKTPAQKADGVDYIPLPTWKIFMIQFLNIAGLGPIFRAIMGAKFGSSSYLWIVLGSILRVQCMIILPECFLCVMEVKVCRK